MVDKSTDIKNAAKRIAVILLNWRDIDATVASVKSIAASHNIIPEVFLLDNGTKEVAFQKLKTQLKPVDIKVHFFATYQNIGFARGVNYLLNKINIANFSAIFLLNNDAKVRPSTLHILSKESAKKNAPMIGPKNKSTKTNSSVSWPWWLFGLRFSQQYDQSKNMCPTCYINGSGLFITTQLVKKILDRRGFLLKNSYYLYGEDTELGLYVQNMDIQPYLSSKTTYIHQTGSYNTERRRMITYYYTTRNRLYLCSDYLNKFLKPIFHIYYLFSRLLIILYRLLKQENKLATAIAEGLRDGYLGKDGKWIKHSH